VTAPLQESLFLRACRREPVSATPVWFMRQAGRSLPEYRAVRDRLSMLKACTTAEVITELTLQPLRRFAVDAAILFSDIVVPLRAVGLDIDIKPGVAGRTCRGCASWSPETCRTSPTRSGCWWPSWARPR